MSKVKINNQELDFKFGFKQIKELVKKTGKDLDKLEEVAKDFNNVTLIASIGLNKSEEEIENLIDADGSFECVTSILSAFSEEVVKYFSPNSLGQTN